MWISISLAFFCMIIYAWLVLINMKDENDVGFTSYFYQWTTMFLLMFFSIQVGALITMRDALDRGFMEKNGWGYEWIDTTDDSAELPPAALDE